MEEAGTDQTSCVDSSLSDPSKRQHLCLGVYELQPGPNAQFVWKHTNEDLCIVPAERIGSDYEEGWCIVRSSSYDPALKTPTNVIMRVITGDLENFSARDSAGGGASRMATGTLKTVPPKPSIPAFPWRQTADAKWEVWEGSEFKKCEPIMQCRPTFHGWGMSRQGSGVNSPPVLRANEIPRSRDK